MAIDQTGTAPGLAATVEEVPEHNMRCKSFPTCNSMLAIELKHAGIPAGSRMYQCCKCKRTWGVPVGGSVDL